MATTDKYDRQLRLWGAAGQRALGESCVVLLGASAVGTETLKNLVLPGVGAVAVVDDATVDGEAASNFFVPSSQSQTTSRAAAAVTYLRELNPDVRGTAYHVPDLTVALQNWETTQNTLAQQLREQQQQQQQEGGEQSPPLTRWLIVASDVTLTQLQSVATLCANQQLPLIVVHSYGLVGWVRLQTPPTALWNPKPRDAPPDWRLVSQFPRLQTFLTETKVLQPDWWTSLDNAQHGHVPYPLILLRCQDAWRQKHDDKLPKTFHEKQAFADSIAVAARAMDRELNFQEAKRNAYVAYTERTLDPDVVRELSERVQRCLTASNSSSASLQTFGVLVQALEQFASQHNQRAPLTGTIPDMTASTQWYIQLQQVYRDQAADDLQTMRQLVDALLQKTPGVVVSEEDLTLFCQNVFTLDLLETRSVAQEFAAVTTAVDDDELVDDLCMAAMDMEEQPEMNPLLWYFAFRACLEFQQAQGRYPGTFVADDNTADETAQLADDARQVQTLVTQLVQRYRLDQVDAIKEHLLTTTTEGASKICQELVRYGQAQVHNIAALIGGVASQEAVKLITGQYTPLHHTYVYNGVASTGGVYRF